MTKVSHWHQPGRQERTQEPPLPMHKSEDLHFGFSRLCVITQACIVAETRLRHRYRCRSYFDFGGKCMNNKKIILAALALAVVIALFAGIWLTTRPDTAAGEKSFTLTVIHNDGTEKVFELTSAEEFLGPALVAEGIIVESDSPGLYNTVDGETADYSRDQSFWEFFVNGASAVEGMNTTPITEGAQYKLVYTIYAAA